MSWFCIATNIRQLRTRRASRKNTGGTVPRQFRRVTQVADAGNDQVLADDAVVPPQPPVLQVARVGPDHVEDRLG
jgi:hypothetical protein